MNIRDLKLIPFAKLIFIATLVILLLTRTPIWHYVSEAFSPVMLAFILAYIMDYAVRFFERKFKIHRGFSIVLTIILFISVLIILGLVVVPSIFEAVASLIKTIATVDVKVDFSFFKQLNFDNIYLKQLQKSIIDTVTPMLQQLTNITGAAVLLIVTEIQKITSGLIAFFISFVIAIYMLAEKKDLIARIKRVIYAYFNDRQVHWIFYISSLSDKIFKDFVIGKLIDSTIIGFLSYFIFSFFKFEYAMLIALIVGITNMIPYFGPFIGAVPAAVITLIASPLDPIQVVYMLLLIFLIQQLDGLVIGPFILGDSVGVSAFWIIVAVTVGGATFGVIGMFLGVPAFVLIKTLIEEDVDKKLASKGYEGLESQSLKIKKTKHTRKAKG